MIIETEGLSRSYGAIHALKKLDLKIHGKAVGLLGANGAGKSTLIKILLGLVRPSAGRARVLEMDAFKKSLSIKERIGYMPENESFIPGMNAVSYVTLAGQLVGMPYRDALRRSHTVLYYAGLDEARYRNVETYSTGMKQRVKLAQAIVHHPKLVFLDEPTTGLDPRGRREMLDLIKDLSRNKGIHVVLSTHILSDVEQVCDQVVILDHGELVRQGSLEEIRKVDSPGIEVSIKGPLPEFSSELRKKGLTVEKTEAGSLHILLENGALDSRVLFEAGARVGAQVRRIVPIQSSLTALFEEWVERRNGRS